MDKPDMDRTSVGLSSPPPTTPAVGPLAYTLGIVLLAVSVGSSLMLVLEHVA